jgi:very-short-patch-repair endonuclease
VVVNLRSRRGMTIFNRKSKEDFRKDLRNSLTPAEAFLWKSLQRRQVLGKKFRRQESIGRYIVDFYCAECAIVVELDGAGHYGLNDPSYDVKRAEYLESLGLRVIRFENRYVFEDLEGVLKTIHQAVLETTTPSAPSKERE